MAIDYSNDINLIKEIIEKMFDGISWDNDNPPDWELFASACIQNMTLYPSSRPLAPTNMVSFMQMMGSQRDSGDMTTFKEHALGHKINVFGNIAVAMSSFEMAINSGAPSRGVNGFLLIKDLEWKIVAICWDMESNEHTIKDDLLSED